MKLDAAFWLSLVLSASSCAGLLLAGRGKWQGWAIGLAGQPVWAAFAIVSKGYGLLLTVAIYTPMYFVNLRRWRRDNRTPEPGACGDPECYVLHADPNNPIHPPFYVDSRTEEQSDATA